MSRSGPLSLTGIALLLAGLDADELRARITVGFPRRPMIGFGIFMAVLLGGMWLPLIVTTFDATSVPQLNGGTTLVVQAFDLGLLVPLGLFTAVAVQRGHVAGYVLSAIVVVKGMAMGAGIAVDAHRRMVGDRRLAASADRHLRCDLCRLRDPGLAGLREHRTGTDGLPREGRGPGHSLEGWDR